MTSHTAVTTHEQGGNSYGFLLRQLLWVALGIAGMYWLMNTDYRKLRQPRIIFRVSKDERAEIKASADAAGLTVVGGFNSGDPEVMFEEYGLGKGAWRRQRTPQRRPRTRAALVARGPWN